MVKRIQDFCRDTGQQVPVTKGEITRCVFESLALRYRYTFGQSVWAGPVEASAIGNLITQLFASGHCRDLAEARELVHRSFPVVTYEPSAGLNWDEAYERFTQLIER